MYECIDSLNKLYSIDEYCILKKENKQPDKIFCPFCNTEAFIRAENSKERTHFMHRPTCEITNYKDIFPNYGNKKSKEEILALKFNILSSSYDIYRYIEKTFNLLISPKLFISILNKIIKKQVLNLQGITTSIIPYIWINELGALDNKLFLYTNKCSTKMKKIWNLNNSKKDIILCINKNSNNTISRSVIPIDTLAFDSIESKMTMAFLKNIIPNIFDALRIDSSYHELLLRDLLSCVQIDNAV